LHKNTLKIVQITVAICLLVALIYHAGLLTEEGQTRLLTTFTGANLRVLFFAVCLGVIINMASAFKWWMLLKSRAVAVGYWRIFCYYLVGQFYNQVLPTSVGGDVVRSYELGKYTGNKAEALASVFVERYTGVLVLLLVAGLAVLIQLSRFNNAFIIASLVAFSIGLGLIAWLIFDLRVYLWIKQQVLARLPSMESVFDKIDKLLDSIADYRQNPLAIFVAFANSFVFYFLAVINVYVTALVFQADVSFADMLIATPIIMLLMNLPISLGNLFLMEASYTGILAIMGYSPALGLSVAVTMRLKSLFDGMLGGVLHPFFVTKRHQ